MAYCTQADLESLITVATLNQLTDDSGLNPVAGVVIDAPEVVIEKAIVKAADEMDSILSVRYPQLPLETVPQLAGANAELAVYLLYYRRSLGHTETAKDFRKKAMDWLKSVRDRKANIIGILDQTGTQDSPGSFVQANGKSKNFNWDSY